MIRKLITKILFSLLMAILFNLSFFTPKVNASKNDSEYGFRVGQLGSSDNIKIRLIDGLHFTGSKANDSQTYYLDAVYRKYNDFGQFIKNYESSFTVSNSEYGDLLSCKNKKIPNIRNDIVIQCDKKVQGAYASWIPILFSSGKIQFTVNGADSNINCTAKYKNDNAGCEVADESSLPNSVTLKFVNNLYFDGAKGQKNATYTLNKDPINSGLYKGTFLLGASNYGSLRGLKDKLLYDIEVRNLPYYCSSGAKLTSGYKVEYKASNTTFIVENVKGATTCCVGPPGTKVTAAECSSSTPSIKEGKVNLKIENGLFTSEKEKLLNVPPTEHNLSVKADDGFDENKGKVECDSGVVSQYAEKTIKFDNVEDKNANCKLILAKKTEDSETDGNDTSDGGTGTDEEKPTENEELKIKLTLANGSFAIGSSRTREFSLKAEENGSFELVITPNPKAIPKLRADQGTVKCVGRTTARFVNSTFTVEKPKKSDECTLTLDESGEHLVELLPDEKSVEMASLISKSVETGKTITFNNINPKAGYDINKAEFICKTTDGQTVELGTNTPGYEVKTSTFLVVNVTASLKCDFKFKEEIDEDPNAVMVHFEFINATSEGKSKYTKSFSEEGQVTFVPNKGYTTIKPILECGVGINSDNEGNIYIFPELMEKKEISCIVEARIDTGEETPTGDYNVELQYVDGTDGLGNKYDTISVNHGETANIFIQGNYLIDKDKKEHKSGIELKKIDCTGDYSTAKIIFEDSKYLVRVEDVESHILCKLDVIKDAGSEYKFTFDINNGSFIKPYVHKFSSSEIGIYTLTIEVGTEVYRKNEDIYTYSEKDILCNIERNKKQENINFELKEGIITIGQVDGNVRCVLTIPGEDDPDALLGLNETCFENEYSLKDKYNDAPASYENAYSRCCEIEGSEEKMGTIVYNRLCGKQVCDSDNVRNLCQPDSTKGYIYEAGKTESGDALKGINKENYKCIMSGKRSEEGNRFELSKDECPNCGNYCTIYCKEDLETIFPGVGYNPKSGSSVNSGEYFTFKPYQDKDKTYDFLPYISQQRTCLYYADITSFSKDVYGTESLNNLTNIKGGYYKEAEMILKEYYSALEEVKKAEESLKEYENRKCIVAYENNWPISPINYKSISKNNSINYLLLDSQKSTITQLSNNNDRCTEEKIGCRCCDKYEWVGSERKCVDFGKYSSWKSDDPEIYTTLTKEECENKAYKTEFEKTEVKYTSNFCEVKTSIRECNSKIETDAEQKKAKESCEKELKNNINTAKEIKKEKTELLDKLKEDYERITLRIKKTIEEFSNCTSYNNSYEEMDIPQISNFRYDEKDLISDLTIQNIDLEIKEDGSEIVFSPPLKYCDNDFNCQETNLKDIKLPVLKKHIENSSANGLNDFLSNQKDKDLETKVFSMAISTTSMSQQYGLNQELYAVKPTGRVVTRDGLVQLGADKYFNYNYLGYGIPIGLKTRAGNYGYSFKISNLGRNNELFDEFSEMNEDGVYMCSYFVRNLIMCPKTGCSPDGEYPNGLIDDLNLIPFIRKINIEDPERLESEEFNTNWTTEEGKSAIKRMIEMGDKQFSDGPLYQFTVGASEIKKVRDYNKENSYSDFKLKCNEDGKECQSEFVTEFSDTEVTTYGRGNWIHFDQEDSTP